MGGVVSKEININQKNITDLNTKYSEKNISQKKEISENPSENNILKTITFLDDKILKKKSVYSSKPDFFPEETYNNIDIDEDIEEGSFAEEDEERNENFYEDIITKNIKLVFIDSKKQKKEQNINLSERSTLSLTNVNSNSFVSISETMDYELNFIKNGNELRESYLAKLINKKVWTPNIKETRHNSIIIFDWDDTLLPTSFLSPGGYFNYDIKLSKDDKNKLSKIENEVLNLLNNAINKGDTYIITNAEKGWVELSAFKFYPKIKNILPKIKIISARDKYSEIFPGDLKKWKIEAFLNLMKYINVKLVTNIISIGDSFFEIEAGKIFASKFREAFIKTIKFKEIPKLDDLLKQLNVVNKRFDHIYSSIRNMAIKVEKKKQ